MTTTLQTIDEGSPQNRRIVHRPLKIRAPDFAGRSFVSFFKRSHKVIVAPTVQEILDEHIAKKLA
jgi:hypothetical protein